MGRPWLTAAALSLAMGASMSLAGCAERRPSSDAAATTPPPASRSSAASPSPSVRTSSTPPRPGSTPPAWLGTRVLPHQPGGFGQVRPTPRELRRRAFTLPARLPMLPGSGFASRVTQVPARVLARSTWQPDCPVAAGDLRWVRLAFIGFDDSRHTGELLVHADAVDALLEVFEQLYAARFPIEQMSITTRAEVDAPPTGDGNNTSAFVCRAVTGGSSYSQHAYGRAVDVNPFQNPYTRAIWCYRSWRAPIWTGTGAGPG